MKINKDGKYPIRARDVLVRALALIKDCPPDYYSNDVPFCPFCAIAKAKSELDALIDDLDLDDGREDLSELFDLQNYKDARIEEDKPLIDARDVLARFINDYLPSISRRNHFRWYATMAGTQINPEGYARNRVSRDLVKHLKQDLRMRWR